MIEKFAARSAALTCGELRNRDTSRMIRSFPFTGESYFSLFEAYNDTIWPAQIVAYLLGLLVVFLALRPMPAGGRIALAILSLFWLWNGLVYHLSFSCRSTLPRCRFAALFALQGLLLAGSALLRPAPAAFRARSHRLGRAWPSCCSRWLPIRCWPGLPVTAGRGRRCSAWRRRH